jgi:hypothetical protein
MSEKRCSINLNPDICGQVTTGGCVVCGNYGLRLRSDFRLWSGAEKEVDLATKPLDEILNQCDCEDKIKALEDDLDKAMTNIGGKIMSILRLKNERDELKKALKDDLNEARLDMLKVLDENKKLREIVEKAIDDEEELEGDMPFEIMAMVTVHPEDTMRAVVKATKASIKKRLKEALKGVDVPSGD